LSQRTLNLGILAHVDAGKTSLTERLLFEHGAVATLGSVDAGTTRTDSGELERERGITIRSAVASFTVGDLRVNLIDTPGHPDFIAEVERALSVLDGAVLVLSAVEGVQAQSRVLMRSLRRLGLPTLIFVNKIDRTGARTGALLADVRAKLGLDVIAMNTVRDAGSRHAHTVPDHSLDELWELLVEQTSAGLVQPVFFGSALTGRGVAELTAGIATLLRPRPVTGRDPRGRIFAIERGAGGEKVAYLRLFAGGLRERQRLVLHRPGAQVSGRITGIRVVGTDERRLTAGDIGKVRGLPGVRVGDRLGDVPETAEQFSPPSLESLVRPADPADRTRLHAALLSLADEDPLIRTRAVGGGETSVLLYGAVQREVLAERLVRDFGVRAVFGEIRPVYFERLCGTGTAEVEFDTNGGDFWATVGLRVAPGPTGSGLRLAHEDEWGALPRAFHKAIEDAVEATLEQGVYGWPVLDCSVTVTRTGYQSPISVAADFRGLTPIVLLRALRSAGTRVHEPCQAFELEIPAGVLGSVLGKLTSLGAEISQSAERGPSWVLVGELPARVVHEFTAALPGLSHGEGAMWTRPGADRPVRGRPPTRERLDGNPLNREEYLRFLSNRRLGLTAS
jgi:ribosomal protection tetracycline resistance protein